MELGIFLMERVQHREQDLLLPRASALTAPVELVSSSIQELCRQ